MTPTFGAFSPMGAPTPTALLAEGMWSTPDCWTTLSMEPVQSRLPGAAEAEDELLLLYAQDQGQAQVWD